MGDDLIFAQKFTRTAADGLALLVEMDDPRAPQESSVVINMMTTMQRGAKRLRARNIYTGAQEVLSALHHNDDATLDGRIKSLGSLVTEYARGLEELLDTPSPAANATPFDKWDMARETLNELLPVAPPDDADMLSRLMRAPVTLATVQPDLDVELAEAEIVPFTKGDSSAVMAEAPGKVEDVVEDAKEAIAEITPAPVPPPASNRTPTKDISQTVALDAMMRDVIADALSVARSVDRTISLSYDMGERTVSENCASDLQTRLGQALSQIIRQSMSDDRVGHIDINLAGEQLHIMAGTTAMRVAIHPQTAPKTNPLISPETEKDLRAQLNSLMKPISLHETAS